MDSNRTATAALRVVNSLVREANAELSVNLVCDYNHEHMKLEEVKRGHIWEVLEATKRSITSERQEVYRTRKSGSGKSKGRGRKACWSQDRAFLQRDEMRFGDSL